jgi:hypothetical protein
MNINQLIASSYINQPPIGQKKTNPFLVAAKLHAKPDRRPSEAGSFEAKAKKDGEGGQTQTLVASKLQAKTETHFTCVPNEQNANAFSYDQQS